MNKKLFFSLFAATGMLFATSCSNDELEGARSGNEAQVTFSLGLEGGLDTRAISDGTGAKKLICAIYDANDPDNKVLLDKVVINDEKVDENGQYVNTDAFEGGLKDNVKITLAKGQTYTMVFWAQNEACKAYTTTDLTDVKVSYKAENGTDDAINNDETRDAFYAAETFKVEGDKEINVTLKRPFAQINVGVDKEDWDAAVASGITIEKSSVVIKDVADKINLLTGAVEASDAMENGITYTLNAIPDETLYVETDETKEGKEAYVWLSMSYILVNDGSTASPSVDGADQSTLSALKYTFAPASGKQIEFEEGLAGAPVQRNYRTNILGKILTGDIQFNITIDPVYKDDYIYPDGSLAQELEMAATFGGTVTLTEDVTLEAPLNVTADMVIDLNGKTITGNFSDKNNEAVINNSGTLKLMGNGTIKNTAENGAAVINNSGKLALDGVTIKGAPIGTTGYPSYAVYTSGELTVEKGTTISSDRGAISMSDGANVTINGGEIKVTDALGTRSLTAHVIYAYGKNSKLTINDGNFEMAYAAAGNTGASVICPAGATIDVYGGNFSYAGTVGQSGIFQNYMGYGALVNVYGGTYNDDTVTKSGNLADGYHAIKSNGTYYVVPEDVSAVATTSDEMAAALTADEENIKVVLANDIDLPIGSLGQITGGSGEYKLGGENTQNIVIDLNGKKLNITTTYWSAIGAKNDDALFTIKNGSMTSTGNSAGTWNAWDLRFSNCNYVFEDVDFKKAVALDNVGKSTLMKNVTITDTHNVDTYGLWITAEGQTVTLDDCFIDMTPATHGRGIKIDNQYIAEADQKKVTLNVKNVTFKTDEKAAILVKSVAGAEINASNLNISEVAADDYFAVWVDEDAKVHADKVVVNGALKAVEGTVAKVSDSSGLSLAIANGDANIVLAGNVTYGSEIENNVIFNLNNNTFEATNTITLSNDADFTMIGGSYEVNGTYGHVDVRPSTAEGSVVTYEDVDFSFNKLSKTWGTCTDRLGSVVEVCATVADAHTKILFKNCTFDNAKVLFEGMSGKTGTFEAVFENCTFKALTSSAPVEVMNYVKGTIKMSGCTFNLTCTSSSASAISVTSNPTTSVTVTAENNTINAVAATPYTYDASKGETEVHNIKVIGTPNNIKFISFDSNTTVNESGTVKTGIAQ